ncbi:hypothetical protein [[Eubacterium] hominis]|uniref:hypothetical protein n=1 Tax=[Eubacterium] hominis TaxID=2764325 RepID=UPI003A4E22E7
MKKYEVIFEELREQTVLIEAGSRDEAYHKGCQFYNENKLEWNENHIDHVDIEIGKTVLEQGSPYDELLTIKDCFTFSICDMDQDNFYGITDPNNDKCFLVLRKEKDTLWATEAQKTSYDYSNNQGLRLDEMENINNDYIVLRFDDWIFMKFNTFRQALQDIKNEHQAIYNKKSTQKYFIVDCDTPFQEVTAKQLHDIHKETLHHEKKSSKQLEHC